MLNLSHIGLATNTYIGDISLVSIGVSCPLLVDLNLSGCKRSTDGHRKNI